MKALLRIGGWTFVALGAASIAFTLVAVATRIQGFTTPAGLVLALAFHATSSVLGLQLLSAARKRDLAAQAEAA